MIKEEIEIHDKFQFDIRLAYQLSREKKLTYKMEAYMFFPERLGINRFNYSNLEFYKDLKSIVRFKSPDYSFDEILNNANSPLIRIKQNVLSGHMIGSFENCEYDIKMLCNIVRRSLLNFLDYLETIKDENDFEKKVGNYLFKITIIEESFRQVKEYIDKTSKEEKCADLFSIADEYFCIIYQHQAFEILDKYGAILKNKPILKKRLHDFIDSQTSRQIELNYPSLPKENDPNESYFYRMTLFKKYFSDILLLDSTYNKYGEQIRQLIFSFSAAIAMILAIVLSYYGGVKYGTYSTSVILALVIGYVLKDRLKDISRNYLADKVLENVHDHKREFFVRNDERKNRVGYTEEQMFFVPENKIPDKISKLRYGKLTVNFKQVMDKQDVFCFKKMIRFYPSLYRTIFHNYPITQMSYSLRINVKSFLKNMNDEEHDLYIQKEDHFLKTKGKRVYHINLIVKLTSVDEVKYKRVRLVMSQNGLKRIEDIDTNEILNAIPEA